MATERRPRRKREGAVCDSHAWFPCCSFLSQAQSLCERRQRSASEVGQAERKQGFASLPAPWRPTPVRVSCFKEVLHVSTWLYCRGSGQLCSRLEPWPCLADTLFCPLPSSAQLRTVPASSWRPGGGGARSSGPEPGPRAGCREGGFSLEGPPQKSWRWASSSWLELGFSGVEAAVMLVID